MADFCGEAWEGLMTRIQASQNASTITDAELDRAFIRLQRLLEKKVRIYWHKIYFEKYAEHKIIPWGLRIQLFPNIKKINDTLKASWESNLLTCSLNMLSMLCNEYTTELAQLDVAINRWYIDHAQGLSSPRYSKRDKTLRAHLEEYTLTTINDKESKFLRDLAAHENGYAYNWDNAKETKPRNKPFTSNIPTSNNHASNTLSASFSSSTSTVYQDLTQEQLAKRRKGDLSATSSESLHRTLGPTPLPHSSTGHSKTAHVSTPFTKAQSKSSAIPKSSITKAPSVTPAPPHSQTHTATRRVSEPTITSMFPANPLPVDPKLASIFLGQGQDSLSSPSPNLHTQTLVIHEDHPPLT